MTNLVENGKGYMFTCFLGISFVLLFCLSGVFVCLVLQHGHETLFILDKSSNETVTAQFYVAISSYATFASAFMASFAAIAAGRALYLQIRTLRLIEDGNRSEYNERIIQEVRNFFLGREFADTRARCWRLKSQWLSNGQVMPVGLASIIKRQVTDDWGSYESYFELQQTQDFQDFAHLVVLLRWFSMMSAYRFDVDTRRIFGDYLRWWSDYLVFVANYYKEIGERFQQDVFTHGYARDIGLLIDNVLGES